MVMFTFLAAAAADSTGKIELLKTIADTASSSDFAGGFGSVGKGIGSIFLLIVAIYYITSILDGGKFQLKMLVPFMIFLFVCNFNWVARPVTSFITTLSGSVVSGCNAASTRMKTEAGANANATAGEIVKRNRDSANPSNAKAVDELINPDDDFDKDDGGIVSDGTEDAGGKKKKERGIPKAVKKGVTAVGHNTNAAIQNELAGTQGQPVSTNRLNLQSLLVSIIDFLGEAFRTVLSILGSTMTGIIVAFGPITWAFAIIPGQGGTIKSWFLRLCQFSLYSPIVALINALAIKTVTTVCAGFSVSSLLYAIAQGIALLAAYTSVPSIAAMIIEGAQGAVSLSSGVQAATSMAGIAGAVDKAGGRVVSAVVGRNNVQNAKDFTTGMKNMGLGGMAKAVASGHGFKGMMAKARAEGREARMGMDRSSWKKN